MNLSNPFKIVVHLLIAKMICLGHQDEFPTLWLVVRQYLW